MRNLTLQASSEQKILKLLLKKEFHESCKPVLTRSLFTGELGSILTTLQAAHELSQEDLHLQEVRDLHFSKHTPTRAARALLNSIFDAIDMEEDDYNEAIARTLLQDLHTRRTALSICEQGAKILDGTGGSFDAIRELLDKPSSVEPETYSLVSSDVPSLLNWASPSNRFPFRLPPLQEAVQGAGRGNQILIFGRPEIGKSSLVADCVVGYMEQGLNVAYFCNEEPGFKIMLNILRCHLNKTDGELRDEQGTEYPGWVGISERLKLYDAVGMSIQELSDYASAASPDILVVDQTDKLHIPGSTDPTHERLKELYTQTREIAKRSDLLLVNVSQASADAEDREEVTFNMLEYSKTGKAGEVDLALGIGKPRGVEESGRRFITISKNKINGWHSKLTVSFDPSRNEWRA